MPRDDLSIDFIGRRGEMANLEQLDAAAVLDEWSNRAANLPAEIAHCNEEILHKDIQLRDCTTIIEKHDLAIQKWIRANGSHAHNPKEEAHRRVVSENYDRAQLLSEEKVALAIKAQQLMDKHVLWLDKQIKTLTDKGEMQHDPELPSLLRSPPSNNRPSGSRVDTSVAVVPSHQLNSAAAPPLRHPNQYPQRPLPAHVQTGSMSGASSNVAPTTPAAALLARQAREASLGVSNKRQRLGAGLGPLPPHGVNVARQGTPGTPRGGTPTTAAAAARAGSAGPRASHKSNKKVAPAGSRQAGALRKPVKKSGLSRVKQRIGTKNSPSSTNDDSEGVSESADDDEARSPLRGNGDPDEEMEDDEGGDTNMYCVCQRVSFGDMVACDNQSCPLEWFHWSCVKLTGEPKGNWICPVCAGEVPNPLTGIKQKAVIT